MALSNFRTTGACSLVRLKNFIILFSKNQLTMGLKVTAKSQVSPADMTPGGSKLREKKKWKKKEKIEFTKNNTS